MEEVPYKDPRVSLFVEHTSELHVIYYQKQSGFLAGIFATDHHIPSKLGCERLVCPRGQRRYDDGLIWQNQDCTNCSFFHPKDFKVHVETLTLRI